MTQDQNKPRETPVALVPAPPAAGNVPVLQKLASPPFPRSGFPLLGILASVYEHVVTTAGRSQRYHSSQPEEPQSPQNTSGRA
jgi:hypothetical protein